LKVLKIGLKDRFWSTCSIYSSRCAKGNCFTIRW